MFPWKAKVLLLLKCLVLARAGWEITLKKLTFLCTRKLSLRWIVHISVMDICSFGKNFIFGETKIFFKGKFNMTDYCLFAMLHFVPECSQYPYD